MHNERTRERETENGGNRERGNERERESSRPSGQRSERPSLQEPQQETEKDKGKEQEKTERGELSQRTQETLWGLRVILSFSQHEKWQNTTCLLSGETLPSLIRLGRVFS